MSEKIEYSYPIAELDKAIEQMTKGIVPVMTDAFKRELELRYMELQEEVMDVEGDEEFQERREKLMQQHIENNRRKARKEDVVIIELTEEQKAQLQEEMETSIVRSNPNSPYNLSDEEVFTSDEKREIYQRLAALSNCYYNQTDYVNAINTIRDAIAYSLANDYPWLSKQDAIKEFNEGKIKFTFCNLPKLYINYQTQITDPEILKGIVSGEVTLVDRNKADEVKPKKRKKENIVGIPYDYAFVGTDEYAKMAKMHQRGYDTPISPIIKMKSKTYNRFALPSTNRFYVGKDQEDTKPMLFDWEREGAGEEYYNIIHGIKYSVSDMIRDLNNDNDHQLNHVLNTNVSEFLRSMKESDNHSAQQQNSYESISSSLNHDERVVELEQNILRSIRLNNPNK